MKTIKPFLIKAKEASDAEIWAGEAFGRQLLPALIAKAHSFDGGLCLLDLSGVPLVTASAFRASLRALREYIAASYQSPTVFVNATPETLEEAEYVASKFGESYVFAEFENGSLENVRTVGQLDEPLRSTLLLLQERGESDARALFEHEGSPGITAWHNRLTDLAARGLLVARTHGRSKTYRAISKELLHGN
jgi:hypothetical protein